MTGSGNQPIRVVVFSGGPTLEHGVQEFLSRLEASPEIELLGVFCQSRGQGARAVIQDLWRRRKLLAVPLLIAFAGDIVWRYLKQPAAEFALQRAVRQINERIHFVASIHAPEVLQQVRALEPDLGLIYGSPILKPELFEIPRHGTLGIHHGKLPEYRGKKTTFWAMYNGEATAGVTIQKINAGLDTGEIVKTGEVEIGQRSRAAVWHELEQLGLDLYLQAILEIKAGQAQFLPFPGVKGKLYRDPKFSDLVRFWWRRWLR